MRSLNQSLSISAALITMAKKTFTSLLSKYYPVTKAMSESRKIALSAAWADLALLRSIFNTHFSYTVLLNL